MVNDEDSYIVYGTRIINRYTGEILLELPGATVNDYMTLLNQLEREYETHLEELENELEHHKQTIHSLLKDKKQLIEILHEKHKVNRHSCQKKNIPIEHINARCNIYEPTK